jgi:hypothetical protein
MRLGLREGDAVREVRKGPDEMASALPPGLRNGNLIPQPQPEPPPPSRYVGRLRTALAANAATPAANALISLAYPGRPSGPPGKFDSQQASIDRESKWNTQSALAIPIAGPSDREGSDTCARRLPHWGCFGGSRSGALSLDYVSICISMGRVS